MRNLYDRTSKEIPPDLVITNKVEQDVLNNLKFQYNAMSVTQISSRNGVSRRTVQRHLRRLINLGLVKKAEKNVHSS